MFTLHSTKPKRRRILLANIIICAELWSNDNKIRYLEVLFYTFDVLFLERNDHCLGDVDGTMTRARFLRAIFFAVFAILGMVINGLGT